MAIDIAKRQADRLRVLKAIFDAADGTTSEPVRTSPTIELQLGLESPRPKKHIIRESLHSVRTILEGAGGNLAAAGLLDALQHINF